MMFFLTLIMFIGIIPVMKFENTQVYASVSSINPVADTFIDDLSFPAGIGATGDTSTAPYTVNWVGTKSGYVENSKTALKYDLSGITGTITDAKLRLFAAELPTGGTTFDLYSATDDSWTNNTTTIPTQGNLLKYDIAVSAQNQWVEVDVINFINIEKAGDGIASFILTSPNPATAIAFSSLEDTVYKPELVLTVINNSTITTTTGTFDKIFSAQADVLTNVTFNGNTLTSITNEGVSLVENSDYTVVGNKVTIKKEYLATQPVGTTNLVFNFSGGDPQTLEITITDTTPAISYTVTFQDYDGTIIGTEQTVSYGRAAIAPIDPIREGYNFTGWDKEFKNVTSDLIITATYEIPNYTVIFKDYDGTVIGTQGVTYGGFAVAPTSPIRAGHTFVGWDTTFDNITSDLVVTAMYSSDNYSVTFKDYDGTVIGIPQTVAYGEAAIAPIDPVRNEYIFIGWDKSFNNVTGDLIVTAMYASNYSTVTFKDYDGTVIGTPQTVAYGSAAVAPSEPTREGYKFIGWDTTFDNVTGDLTVTATYVISQYTVTFRDYDGTVIGTPQTVDYGAVATAPTSPLRTGFVFVGWDKSFDNIISDLTVTATYGIRYYTVLFKDYDGTVIGNAQTVAYGEAAVAPTAQRQGYTFKNWDKTFDYITENLVITAIYEANQYTVTFKDYDGVVIGEAQVVKFGDAAVAPAEPARLGYTFIGWDTAFDKVQGDLIVTATYAIDKFTVTFKDYDGTVIGTPQTIDYGKDAVTPEDPIRVGYEFTGWDKTFDNVTEDLFVTATYITGKAYTMDPTAVDSNTNEFKSLVGYFESGKNTIVINDAAANLIIPASVVAATDLVGAEYIKVSRKIVSGTSKDTLVGKMPKETSLVGNVINFKLQVFDKDNDLIKDIHNFANEQKVKISIKLTGEDIKDLYTDRLSMYYFDETEDTWVELGGSFNKTTMEFEYNTSHFTNFAVLEKQQTTATDNSGQDTTTNNNGQSTTTNGNGTTTTNGTDQNTTSTGENTASSNTTSGESTSSNNTTTSSQATGEQIDLPKTGSAIDFRVLIIIGGALILGGALIVGGVFLIKRKSK
ncbi:cell wall/surface repeat protein [Clostridium cellulovorans 743B]|uniref:Cell wall/surface repeat protein n=2 Tax=Clostridium cellulovorans TaxID=1493 RepID=D9STF3_CLOC7|nr:cell wall/surface repeat protein [Clostridium cellulovorans 743B]